MLDKVRKFSGSIFAKIILAIVAVPFIFWGMGSSFNQGGTNTLAKINNERISTDEFLNFVNSNNLNREMLQEKINENIIEELLAAQISQKLLELEMNELNLNISDEVLAFIIKNNSNFHDEKSNFSRIKYEKFLLENSITASQYESSIKENKLKNKLFLYISGGIISPKLFVNKIFSSENKKLNIAYINLKNNYKKKESFTKAEIDDYIKKNSDELKITKIDFKYVKITPNDLVGSSEYNELFFRKIDEIDDKINNDFSIENIANQYNLKLTEITNFNKDENLNNEDKILDEIYENKGNKNTQLVEKKDYFLIYQIKNLIKILPDVQSKDFTNNVIDKIFIDEKNKYNMEIFEKIRKNEFTDQYFNQLAEISEKKEIILNSIDDNTIFNVDSVKLIYQMPLNSFSLITDDENNIYISKILGEKNELLDEKSNKFNKYFIKSNNLLKNKMYTSYDFYLNNKYKIKINEKTLERVKNYFK